MVFSFYHFSVLNRESSVVSFDAGEDYFGDQSGARDGHGEEDAQEEEEPRGRRQVAADRRRAREREREMKALERQRRRERIDKQDELNSNFHCLATYVNCLTHPQPAVLEQVDGDHPMSEVLVVEKQPGVSIASEKDK